MCSRWHWRYRFVFNISSLYSPSEEFFPGAENCRVKCPAAWQKRSPPEYFSRPFSEPGTNSFDGFCNRNNIVENCVSVFLKLRLPLSCVLSQTLEFESRSPDIDYSRNKTPMNHESKEFHFGSGCQFNWLKNRLKNHLKNHLRSKFNSVTCLN